MPTVPVPSYQRVSGGGASVTPSALPSVRQTPDAPAEFFGGNQNAEAAVKPAADAISSIALDARNKANAVAITEGDNEFAKLVTDLQFNQQNGLMTRKGDAVKGAYDEFKEKFDKAATDITSKYAQNEDQRIGIAKLRSNYWQNFDANIQKHTASELESHAVETYGANLKNQQFLAATNYHDPKQVQDSMTRQNETIDSMAGLLGKDKEWVTTMKREAKSDTYVEMVKGMLVNNQVKTARGFFDKNRADIDPTKALALDGAIDGKLIYNRVQQVSDFAQGARLEDGTMDLKAVHGYVDKMGLSPEDAYKVESHIQSIYAVDTAQTKQRQANALQSATEKMIDYESRGVPLLEAMKLGGQFGWNNKSTAQIQDMVTKVYASPADKFNTWIGQQAQGVQSAWAETESIVNAKYGNTDTVEVGGRTYKARQLALEELKQDVLGKSADQIREITNKQMENVTTGTTLWGFWHNKDISWKVDAGVKMDISQKYSDMEKEYGPDRVSQARATLALNGVPVTPDNVKALIKTKYAKP